MTMKRHVFPSGAYSFSKETWKTFLLACREKAKVLKQFLHLLNHILQASIPLQVSLFRLRLSMFHTSFVQAIKQFSIEEKSSFFCSVCRRTHTNNWISRVPSPLHIPFGSIQSSSLLSRIMLFMKHQFRWCGWFLSFSLLQISICTPHP